MVGSSTLRIVIGVSCLLLAAALGSVTIFGSTGGEKMKPPTAPVTAPPSDFVAVVTAAADIARGDRIQPHMLTTLRVADAQPSSTFRRPSDVAGAIALEDIRAGQILIRSAVMTDESARPGLSLLVPRGKRAVALRVNDEVAVGNFVRPNDKVDIELVIAADQLAKMRGEDVRKAGQPESRVLLQNVTVLSVGEALRVEQDSRAIRMQNLTVAVTPKEALLIALAKQMGSFYLALRHPSDGDDVGTAKTTVWDLLGPRHEKATPPPRARTGHRVIVLQGGKETYQTVR